MPIKFFVQDIAVAIGREFLFAYLADVVGATHEKCEGWEKSRI